MHVQVYQENSLAADSFFILCPFFSTNVRSVSDFIDLQELCSMLLLTILINSNNINTCTLLTIIP